MSGPDPVAAIPAADPREAAAHFAALLRFETDCADVRRALAGGPPGFLLLDVRPPESYQAGHIETAINLPHGRITRPELEALPPARLHVVYCAGPHCNGADRAALRLAELGRPVKKMLGGITGWLDEGFVLVR